MKELDEIDRLFQKTFEEFELTPDPIVKANIDRAIASKKKRRFLFILFPVLFGTALAAILYTNSVSGKLATDKPVTSQNPFSDLEKKTNISSDKPVTHTENEHATQFAEKQETGSLLQSNIKRNHFEGKSSGETKAASLSKNNSVPAVNSKPVLSNVQTLVPAEIKTAVRADESLARLENQTEESVEPNTPEEKTQDITTTVLQADSLSNEITETVEMSDPEKVKKAPAQWSLAIITGWENEKKRAAENFDTTDFTGNTREFARIHTTSFYGKIEMSRKLSNRFDIIAGLGFRSSDVKQSGSLYSRDSLVTIEGVGSVPSLDSFSYFIRKQNGELSYQVNSILLPLGLSFSTPLSQRFNFRLSGGTEFAYGWVSKKQSHPDLSSARFRPFGWNVWLRPEIHYTFGKLELFGFGSFNQPLYQQLKWDFKVRRNPLFGAGIGLLIRL